MQDCLATTGTTSAPLAIIAAATIALGVLLVVLRRRGVRLGRTLAWLGLVAAGAPVLGSLSSAPQALAAGECGASHSAGPAVEPSHSDATSQSPLER